MSKALTWAQVLDALKALSPEQLQHEAIVLPDEEGVGGCISEVFVQTEDHVCTDEVWEPRAEFLASAADNGLTPEEAEQEAIVSRKGQPYLIFKRPGSRP